jgi:NAD(P)-dependent dehydrogenase (short-subunit alcohol dehydrogenase family)
VTGSGRGLGREYALLLARLGAAVVVNSTTEETSRDTLEEITKAGGKAIAHVGSVADRAVANAMVEAAVKTFGRIDIVINNAGNGDTSYFEDVSSSKLWDMLGVHVGGSWNVTQAAWPHMKKQKYGRVIMTTSLMMVGLETQSVYGTAKMALVGLTKAIALDGKEHNIHVNSVAPSGYTPLAERALQNEQLLDLMRRFMPAAEVAPAVLWLVHEGCEVNGESFTAQGRLVARLFLAETLGFHGPADRDWNMEIIRDNWNKVVDETGYIVHTDVKESGPRMFARVAGAEVGISSQLVADTFRPKDS